MTGTKKFMMLLMSASMLMAGQALAEDRRGEGVADRARPEFDPAGVRMGSFLLFPTLDTTFEYDDNVGRASANPTESYGLIVAPELQLRSEWGRHELNLTAQSISKFYEQDSDLDFTDYGVGMDGRLDISSSTSLEGEASFAELNEELRTTTAPTGAAEPTEYSSWDVGLQLNQRFNRVTSELEVTYGERDYDDVPNNIGGTIDSDLRDRSASEVRLRAGYDVNPDVNLFIEGALNEVDYDQAPPIVTVDRDSDGYRVGAGAAFDVTSLISGEVVVGYLEQDYDSAALADVSGLAADVDIGWNVTPLTTILLGAGSSVEQSDATASGGLMTRYVEVGVDHELLRNVILSAGVGFENNDFEGITREDDIFTANVGALYLINRNASVSAGYTFEERDSNPASRDYDRNRFGVTLRLQI